MVRMRRIGGFPKCPPDVQEALRGVEDNAAFAVEELGRGSSPAWRAVILKPGVYRASAYDMVISTEDCPPTTSVILPKPVTSILGTEIIVIREFGNPTIYASDSLINGLPSWSTAALRAERFVACRKGWVTYA